MKLNLTPEAEARLRELAEASGLSPEEWVGRMVEGAVSEHPHHPAESRSPGTNGHSPLLSSRGTLPQSEIDRRLAMLDRLAGSVDSPGMLDDSRESIYESEDDWQDEVQ